VQVEVMHSEAATYQEFSNSLSNPVILGVINFAPLEGNVIMEMATSLGYTIVDRMLGGSGQPLDKNRDFTEIELTIIERIMVICTNLLVEPWHSVQQLEPVLERIETNSQFAQFVTPNEMTSIITMSITIGDVEGLMNVCIPFAVLEPVIDKVNTKYWYSTSSETENGVYRPYLEESLQRAKIPVRAIMGRSAISVNDFIHLRPGDIIKVNTRIEDELDVYVGNIKKFSAIPGAYEDSYAVKIKSIYREE
jgi:flagellar motor switch protein FliM